MKVKFKFLYINLMWKCKVNMGMYNFWRYIRKYTQNIIFLWLLLYKVLRLKPVVSAKRSWRPRPTKLEIILWFFNNRRKCSVKWCCTWFLSMAENQIQFIDNIYILFYVWNIYYINVLIRYKYISLSSPCF